MNSYQSSSSSLFSFSLSFTPYFYKLSISCLDRKVGTVVNRKRKERINLFAPFVGDKKKTDSTGQARPDGKSSSSSYYK